MGRLVEMLKYIWRNPIVSYIGVIFAEWFYCFCRSKYPGGKVPTVNIPMDANNDGMCDHCGQHYTVGMDKEQNESEHIETSETAKSIELESKPKTRRRATKKIETLEEPKVAKPRRATKAKATTAKTKKTTTRKKTTKEK